MNYIDQQVIEQCGHRALVLLRELQRRAKYSPRYGKHARMVSGYFQGPTADGSGRNMAEDLGVSPRTVSADLRALCRASVKLPGHAASVPVLARRRTYCVGFKLGTKAYPNKPNRYLIMPAVLRALKRGGGPERRSLKMRLQGGGRTRRVSEGVRTGNAARNHLLTEMGPAVGRAHSSENSLTAPATPARTAQFSGPLRSPASADIAARCAAIAARWSGAPLADDNGGASSEGNER